MPRFNLASAMAILLAILPLLVAACEDGVLTIGDEGSGVLVTETRTVEGFTSVEVGAALNLDLTVDPAAAPDVTVTFDDNLIDSVVTRISDGTLILDVSRPLNITGSGDRRIEVTMNDLESLEASGAADVDASGTTSSYQLTVSGASDVNTAELIATDVDVNLSGAANVDLYAAGVVRGSISGASSLRVLGEPQSVLVDSSGASTVDIKD